MMNEMLDSIQRSFVYNPSWLVLLYLWVIPWKAWALWIAARKGSRVWFAALLIICTMAILDILYIFFFSKGTAGKGKRRALR
jgi:hypothetical protein